MVLSLSQNLLVDLSLHKLDRYKMTQYNGKSTFLSYFMPKTHLEWPQSYYM